MRRNPVVRDALLSKLLHMTRVCRGHHVTFNVMHNQGIAGYPVAGVPSIILQPLTIVLGTAGLEGYNVNPVGSTSTFAQG
jgi:hypothetical protein